MPWTGQCQYRVVPFRTRLYVTPAACARQGQGGDSSREADPARTDTDRRLTKKVRPSPPPPTGQTDHALHGLAETASGPLDDFIKKDYPSSLSVQNVELLAAGQIFWASI